MNFHLPISIPFLNPRIQHHNKIMLMGSCFTEHITSFLNKSKFSTSENSHGILFNPWSICKAIDDIIFNKKYTESDLFHLDEYYHSWFHHSDFSALDKSISLEKINASIEKNHQFLKETKYLIITLGSAFAYFNKKENTLVSNNHRAPHDWFEKRLLEISEIKNDLEIMQQKLQAINPNLQIIYTISPVRHSRDGVIENNRSKARLLEAVHQLKDAYYFPAYELVIDVLRDYRFYDMDLVHPNYQATQYVWEQFIAHCIDENALPLMRQLEQITKAKNHRPKDVRSLAHQKFLKDHFELCLSLKNEFQYLDLEKEIGYFESKN